MSLFRSSMNNQMKDPGEQRLRPAKPPSLKTQAQLNRETAGRNRDPKKTVGLRAYNHYKRLLKGRKLAEYLPGCHGIWAKDKKRFVERFKEDE